MIRCSFAPFVPFFDPRIGRPSTPMETYLRLMFLKFRYRLGYESLCREVSDSITWRRFCRIAATRRRIQAAGGATRTTVRDRSRSAGKRAHVIGAKLRMRSAAGKDEALAAVRRVTGELADLAETAAKDADRVLVNAKRALRRARTKAKQQQANGSSEGAAAAGRRRGRLACAVDDLTDPVAATRQIAAQTRQRLAGVTPNGATRRGQPARPGRPPDRQGPAGVSRSSSVTRPSLLTTRTVWSWTSPSNKATRPTPHSLPRRSNGSPDAPADHPGRSPPTAATANRKSTTPFTEWASARS